MKMLKGTPWKEGVEIERSPLLQGTIEADAAIVGGGLCGVVTAYLLAKAGKKAVILEKKKVGGGATEYTTAFLTQVIDTDIGDLREMFGDGKAALVLESHRKAIDLAEGIARENGIECEFRRVPSFSYANDDIEREGLLAEAKAAEGMPIDIEFLEDDALGFPNRGYLRADGQAKFHPLKYLSKVLDAAKRLGVEVYEDSEVLDITGKGPYVVETAEGSVIAGKVIVASYGPLKKKLYFKKAFYDSYVIEAEVPSGAFPEGIYEDNMEPYHYFRVDPMGEKDRIIIGGEDHRSDVPVDELKSFAALIEYAEGLFAGVPHGIVRRWKGPIVEPVDGLAFIGPHKDPNIYYATGFSGNGMTYSHIAASIITDHITGKKNKYAEIYDAHRKPAFKHLIKKGRDYTEEFIGGAVKNSLKQRRKKS
ncbi:MAG: FAD-binding oxidoreductase [Candidatus Taylorbacteria bacterium]|nr:FAD-binding oxidoreductase [Candidatus Taylorbacteria bacterium]